MKTAVIIAISCALLGSCKNSENQTSQITEVELTPNSQALSKNFPLLPLIEKRAWALLLEYEAIVVNPNATDEQLSEAEKQIDKIITRYLTKS